jgi:hypothetical protein
MITSSWNNKVRVYDEKANQRADANQQQNPYDQEDGNN